VLTASKALPMFRHSLVGPLATRQRATAPTQDPLRATNQEGECGVPQPPDVRVRPRPGVAYTQFHLDREREFTWTEPTARPPIFSKNTGM
jgi:hypothetical protein